VDQRALPGRRETGVGEDRPRVLLEGQEQELALVLHVEEQRAGPDPGAIADVARGGGLEAAFGEQRARRNSDALPLVSFVPFPKPRTQVGHFDLSSIVYELVQL